MSPEFSFVNVGQATFQLHPSRYFHTFALALLKLIGYRLRWLPRTHSVLRRWVKCRLGGLL
jgi:hypothetical protein